MPPASRLVVVLAIAAFMLWRSLPGALLCLLPGSMRQRPEPDDEPPPAGDPEPIRLTAPALEALGFARLGVRREIPLLGQATLSFDYFNAAERSYASLYLVDRKTRRLYFLTPYDGGAAVLTADHRRPGAVQDGYYLAGGLPNATPAELWAAHRRQMAAMEETGRERTATPDLAGRIAAARAWFTGVGKREMRLRNLTPAAITILALFMLYVAIAGAVASRLHP